MKRREEEERRRVEEEAETRRRDEEEQRRDYEAAMEIQVNDGPLFLSYALYSEDYNHKFWSTR